PATALAEAERGGRARAADPHRGILPGVSLLAGVGIEPRTAPVGTHLQHGSPAPGLGLSHPAAVSAAGCSTTKGVKCHQSTGRVHRLDFQLCVAYKRPTKTYLNLF